jgi:hemerythrin-like domain-containing protein
MDLFDRLGDEHQRIAAVTSALDVFAGTLQAGQDVDVHELLRFVTFLGVYGSYHHEIEETVLFPTLALCGFALDTGPLGHLRDQHREEGRLLSRFEMAAAARRPWSAEAVGHVVLAARELAAFLRAHMAKERDLFFPVARREIMESHGGELAQALRHFETRRAPRWNLPWLEQLGDELVAANGA